MMYRKLVVVLVSTLAVGCTEVTDDEDPIEERLDEIEEITENLLAAGYAEDDIEVVEVDDPLFINGEEVVSAGPQVIVGGDVHVTLEASRALLAAEDDEGFRLWRTPGLVNNSTTICLARATSWVPNEIGPPVYGLLTTDMANGVVYAAGNYNVVANMGLHFEVRDAQLDINGGLHLTPAATVGCTYFIGIVQYWNGTGGISGFPPGDGTPYNYMRISGNASDQVFEHIVTHEIGHCIGLRHSDWQTRASCGLNVNEGQLGASLIPGTVNQTTNSIMASCFGAGTDGEFRGEDAFAISTLY